MRGTSLLAAARAPLNALALACLAGATWSPAVALSATKHAGGLSNAPFSYETSGIVGIGAAPASVSGPAVLQFQGLTGASYDPKAGQPISLGQFVIAPASVAGGATTTYNGTPFEVEIHASQLDKTSSFPVLGKLFPALGKDLSLKTLNENSVLLKGTLTGGVGPDGRANVTATVASVKLGSLDAPTKDHITHYTFPIRFSQLRLPASWVMSGTTVPTGSDPGLNPAPVAAPVVVHALAHASRAPMIAQAQLIAATSAGPAAPLPAPLAAMSGVGNPTPTPEPSTILLFATTFGGLALARRRLARTPRPA